MKLHENEKNFTDTLTKAAEHFQSKGKNLTEFLLEKDYWVTYILKKISNSGFEDFIVFKGGTSLSKVFGSIERFSEDIDLALIFEAMKKDGIHKKETKAMKKVMKAIIPTQFENDKEDKGNQTALGIYKRVFDFPIISQSKKQGQIHDKVIVEINTFSNPAPVHKEDVRSYIADFWDEVNLVKFISEYDMETFQVGVVDIRRTYCEKILAVRRAWERSMKDGDDFEFFGDRVRHLYDLHMVKLNGKVNNMLSDDQEFKKYMKMSLSDDNINKRNTNKIYESDIYINPENCTKMVKDQYALLKDYTFDNTIPSEEEINTSLLEIGKKLKKIDF